MSYTRKQIIEAVQFCRGREQRIQHDIHRMLQAHDAAYQQGRVQKALEAIQNIVHEHASEPHWMIQDGYAAWEVLLGYALSWLDGMSEQEIERFHDAFITAWKNKDMQ